MREGKSEKREKNVKTELSEESRKRSETIASDGSSAGQHQPPPKLRTIHSFNLC